jgi:hypothetical protein
MIQPFSIQLDPRHFQGLHNRDSIVIHGILQNPDLSFDVSFILTGSDSFAFTSATAIR